MPIPYNHDHENEISLFAQVNFRNQFRRFGIKTEDRRRHMYVMGKTGMGKTTLLENMVLSDILAGHGVCFIDPHGDTAERLLDYIPSHRINDVVYFNPADQDFPVGFNILEVEREEQKHLVASGLMGVFKKIWPDVWSPRMEYILLNCVLALLDYPGSTLLGISRLLVDQEYRKRVVVKIQNPIVKTFWVTEFASWSEKYATEAIAPILNKVGQFLSASIIRNIVAQVKSTINPRQIMDEGKIFIVNLSKGKIGEDNMRLLGGMVITKLQLAAMERVDIKNEEERRDFYLFVDEFQNFANESFASILSEARKYRLNLIIAHQFIGQLTAKGDMLVRDAIFGNVGTIIVMRIGGEDAVFLENEFTPTFTPEDMVNLPKYQMYLKLMVDGVATAPFSATALPPIGNRTGSEQKVIAVSRERYAQPRAVIEEKVLRWSGMETAGAEQELTYPSIRTAEERELGEELGVAETAAAGRTPTAPEGEEFLRISPERMKALVKPKSKKEKPMFSHTCSRCGKTWEMPVQLDPTRPMFCSECLPLAREERKVKKTVLKSAFEASVSGKPAEGIVIESAGSTNERDAEALAPMMEGKGRPAGRRGRGGGPPNRPRIVGDAKRFSGPPSPPPTAAAERPARAVSLLAELERAKGKRIETDKKKLEDARSSTVFKPAASSVNHVTTGPKPIAPGQRVTFE
ncbi:type IV secretion system DNA-binding domain-containing protein [Candidatus Uhrbacteria bacterium]|nr:type IV secretion system DNA-binding domain-containing protein [Candidatus Uhrbacteria bacterium]